MLMKNATKLDSGGFEQRFSKSGQEKIDVGLEKKFQKWLGKN